MQTKIYIAYKGPNPKNDSDIDLKALGKSLMGLDSTIEKLLRVIHVKGDIEIKATKTQHGSIEIEILIFLLQNTPFNNIDDFIKLIQFCDPNLLQQLYVLRNQSFGQVQDIASKVSWDSIINDIVTIRGQYNEILGKNPDINMLVSSLFSIGLTKLFSWGKEQKEKPQIHDSKLGDIPSDYAIGLHKMIKNKGFHKTLKPFIEQEFEQIKVYTEKDKESSGTIINGGNFDKYLSGLSEILPNFVNGQKYRVTGTIVNYQSARGDTMKIQLDHAPKKHRLITLYPADGASTKDYIDFYQEQSNLYIEVIRRSVYQKPQFILRDINKIQEKLLDDKLIMI